MLKLLQNSLKRASQSSHQNLIHLLRKPSSILQKALSSSPSPPFLSTHEPQSSSFHSWPSRSPTHSPSPPGLLRTQLTLPVPLKRAMPTAQFPACLRDLSDHGIRFFRFSLQKRPRGFGGNYYGQHTHWRSFMSSSDNVLYGLIGANVAVFLLWRFADPVFMEKHFTISLANVKSWRLHTFITSAFSHIDDHHIFTNMLGLYFFGSSVGKLFGPEFLLKMYIAGALGGSIFYVLHKTLFASSFMGTGTKYNANVPGLGASGAVNAIMLLYIFLFPKSTIYLQFFIPVPAALMGAIMIGTDLWRAKKGDAHVSGSAHLGGAVVAALVWARVAKHWI